MGEVLGLGISHYPGFSYLDEDMSMRVKRTMTSPKVPDELKDPSNWPEQMQREWSDDEGLAFAAEHRQKFVDAVRRMRRSIDEFNPDVVLVFGDDQYENFKEDLVPPFAVYIQDEFRTQPFLHGRGGEPQPNVWGLPHDERVVTRGDSRFGRFLATQLTQREFDVAYSYTGHHLEGLGHAFINTVLYLDYDRAGWAYPTVPFHLNAYGAAVVRNRGEQANLFSDDEGEPDPPAPTPKRCFDLGAAVARAISESPYRVAIVGSSSWSHAFLTAKNHFMYPDVEADRARFGELSAGDLTAWRDLTLDQLEASGQHELLNWMPMVGAMHELGRKPDWAELNETYLMNSSKVSVLFEP